VLDAVDIGYRVIVVRDAVCSSSDEGHEVLMRLYHTRYTEQIETADAEAVLELMLFKFGVFIPPKMDERALFPVNGILARTRNHLNPR
jgi:Isochorismatase family